MRKPTAYLLMVLILALLAGADFFVLTSSASLSRLAGAELAKIFGDTLEWRKVRASLDGRVSIRGAALHTEGRRFLPLEAEEVEIRSRGWLGGDVEKVVLTGVRLSLSQDLLDELSGRATGRSIRDAFPDPERLPRILCRGGRVEARLPAAFAGDAPQVLAIRELSMTPIGGYRCYVDGRFEHPEFGAWRASGEVDLDTGALRIALSSSGLRVGPGTREPLSANLKEAWDKYNPEGLCDLRLALAKEPGAEVDFCATLVARDMGLLYRPFPYKADRISGEIDFLPGGFRVKHMTGRHGDAVVRFDGSAGGYAADADYAFRIEIDRLPLDADLRAALDPDGRRVFDLFAPKGLVKVRGLALRERGPDRPGRLPLDLSIEQGSFRFKDFPYELRNVAGDFLLDSPNVLVRRLVGRDGDSAIDISGRIDDLVGDAAIDLLIFAKGLPLDARLRDALPAEPRKTWEQFDPSGTVDLTWRLRKEKGKEPAHRAHARARGASVTYRELPLRVTDIEGDIELEPGLVRLNDLTGKARGAVVEAHGEVRGDTVELHLGAAGLKLDDPVKEALPREIGGLLKEMRLGGVASFTAGIKLLKSGRKILERLDLRLTQGVIDTEPRFTGLEGSVGLTGTLDGEPRLMGFLNFSRAVVAGKRVTDLAASVNVIGARVNFVNIKAGAYGGVVSSPSFFIDTRTGDLGGSFHVDRLDMREYALDTSGFSRRTLAGKASLELSDLSGKAADPATLKAKGRLMIREAFLWDIPVFLSVFQLNPQDVFKAKNQFDAGVLDFVIRERKFDIDNLAFTSQNVSLVGKGWINFDGEMSLRMKPSSGPLLGIDILPLNAIKEIFNIFASPLMGVHVSGTFESPKVKVGP